MFHNACKAIWWLAAMLVLTLSLPSAGQYTSTGNSDNSEHGSKKVTGCIQKGDEPGGFVLVGEDGKTWELVGSNSKLAEHTGHKVTVTGSQVHESKAHEEKMEKNEKKEAEGKEYGDLKVDKVEMVSDSCK